MNNSKFFKSTLVMILVLLLPIGLFGYMADPFFYFHKPIFSLTSLTWEYPLYQNIGASKTFTYQAAIIGSSTSLGFDPSWYKKNTGFDTIQLSISGARPYDNIYLINQILKSKNDVKEIYYGFDCFHLQTDPDSTLFKYDGLMDSNMFTRYASYLLSSEMDLKYNSQVSFTMEAQTLDDYNTAYMNTFSPSIVDTSSYGLDSILSTYHRKESRSLSVEAKNITINAEKNARNLVNIAYQHPNTNFIIYIMPASMVYWDSVNQLEEIDCFIDGLIRFSELCLQASNIELYCFVDDEDMNTAYEYYSDYIHHNPELDKWIADNVLHEKGKIHENNVQKRFNLFRDYLKEFNYEELVISK